MKITKQLILDHFNRKTSPLQRERIAEWVEEGQNEEQYYAWLEEWEREHMQYEVPTDPQLARYLQFVDANPHSMADEAEEQPLAGGRRRAAWLAAATVALLMGLSGWLFQDRLMYETHRTAYGEVRSLVLDDGSAVKLNTNSSLKVPRWAFLRGEREVYLEGEASFSVTHTADGRKFVVHTPKNLDVVVLGTEFTLYARRHHSRVVLEKGKVQVRYRQDQQRKEITMKPGDLVTLDNDNRAELRTTQRAEQYSEWEEKRFIFEETTLEELAYRLREDYGLDVQIEGAELAQREFMGSFRAKDVDELLLSLSELLDITVSRQGKQVRFTDR